MTEALAHSAVETRKSRGSRIVKWTLLVLLVVALTATTAIALWARSLGSTFDAGTSDLGTVFPEEREVTSAKGNPQTFLLLGSDSRAELDDDDMSTGISRSDTIMVVRVPEDRSAIYVMSILRDSWVDIPGYGEAKINAASAYGGVPLAVETIEGLLGTQIDHVAMIDFEGFKGLTDALGGVTLTNPHAFTTHPIEGPISFDAGVITLDGQEALAFVRERYAFADGDYQRARNQQIFLKALIRQFLSTDTLTNPGKIQDAVGAVAPYVSVDSGLDSSYLMSILPSMTGVRSGDIHMFTAPTLGTGTSDDGQSIVVMDEVGMEDLRQAFQNDSLGEYLEQVGTESGD